MNIALWIVQALLGAAFIMAGFTKTTTPIDKLSIKMPWAKEVPQGLVRFIGISQLLGGIGLILPWLTGIMPILTPLAACGLAINMLLALAFHINRKEYNVLAPSFILGLLAAFVAWGRF